MADNMKQGGMPEGGIIPRRDVKPLADEIQSILDEAGMGEAGPKGAGGVSPGTAGESGALPGSGGTGAEGPGAEGSQIIAEVLGVSPEKAQALYDAAMAMPRFAGKSPAEIAEMLDKDMNLRMQLEKNLGASQDQMARKMMAEDGMPAPKAGPPPMEPTPAGSTK